MVKISDVSTCVHVALLPYGIRMALINSEIELSAEDHETPFMDTDYIAWEVHNFIVDMTVNWEKGSPVSILSKRAKIEIDSDNNVMGEW